MKAVFWHFDIFFELTWQKINMYQLFLFSSKLFRVVIQSNNWKLINIFLQNEVEVCYLGSKNFAQPLLSAFLGHRSAVTYIVDLIHGTCRRRCCRNNNMCTMEYNFNETLIQFQILRIIFWALKETKLQSYVEAHS